MSVERVAGSPWNQWPDVHGIGGRMAVESAVKYRHAPELIEELISSQWWNRDVELLKTLPLNDPHTTFCLLYTSPSPRDATLSRMPSSA